ncbi:MAG: HutD family protein [Zavarzinia sp.]|nr:HutD family protein [Zavarzinia sp.]
MAILFLPMAAHQVMPWANGGGTTAEVAIHPPGASVAARDFDWRISMAHVGVDGPFSALPGFDRSLTLIEGQGMILDAGTEGCFTLAEPYDQALFPGDWAITARLLGGPIDDLNVMTRRGAFSATVEILTLLDRGGIETAPTTVLVGLEGRVSVAGGPDLGPRDAALIDGRAGGWLSLSGNGIVAVIRLLSVAAPLHV